MSNIILSSNHRSFGTSSSGKLTLTNSLNGSYKLKKMIITNGLYSVNDKNNVVYINESTVLKQGLLTNGTYTATQLASHLQSRLDIISGVLTYGVTYNSETHKFSFSASGNFGFAFSNTLNSSFKLLGKNALDDVEAVTQESENIIDLSPHKIFYFNFPSANNDLLTSNNQQSSFTVSVDAEFGNLIRQDYMNDNIILKFSSQKNILYQVHDLNGDDIDLNGGDWHLIMSLQ